jgi:hypothetical protein
MRLHQSVFSLFCLLPCAACTSTDPDTETVDSATGVAPLPDGASLPDGGSSGPGASHAPGIDGSAAAQADAQAWVPAEGGSPAPADAGSPPQSDAGPQGTCPNKYATAQHTRMELSWPDTAGYWGGNGDLLVWSKVTYTRMADGSTMVEAQPCGVSQPALTASELIGEGQLSNDVPLSTFEKPSMPRLTGRATWRDGKQVIETGAYVLGASLSDPEGPWPFRASLQPVDHDADGKPGVTAIARQDPPFLLPPVDILFTQYLEQAYTASRVSFRLTAPSEGCSAPVVGSVEPIAFDYMVIGCRIKDGGECGERELNLIENQNPVFTLGSTGQWRSVPIADSASCADVRNAFPSQGT